MKTPALAIVLLAGLALSAGSNLARAQTVVSNLLNEGTPSTTIISETKWTASSFTTDSSAASFALSSVTLRMRNATVDNTFFAGFRVAIYSNGGDNKPGTLLASFSAGDSGTGEPVTAGDYVYSLAGTTLAANTTYWTVVAVVASQPLGVYNGNLLSNNTVDAGSTWTLGKYSLSDDAGATWGFASNGGMMMSIQASASAIPEPSTYAAMAGLGVLGLAVWRRRGVRKAA